MKSEIWWISWNPWNPADFTKISPVKSTQNYKSKCFSKNSSVWWMQGGGYDQGFHEIHQISPWNLVDFTHEIWQISPVKSTQIIKASVSAKTLQFDECMVGAMTKDFMKSTRFHLKSGRFDLWNPVDFTQISPVKSTQNYKSKCFSKNSSVWWMQGGGYDQGFHLWNPAEFTQISSMKSTQNYKSKCFSKNSSVWWMQGGGFHPWNPVDFTWNLVDFTCEIWWISPRFDLWNPPKIIKASVSAKTLQFDECRVGAMTKDFTCEIQQSSPRFHLWNPPKIIKASVSAKTLQFDECKVGAMTKDFIKSTGFHVKSAWNPLDFKIMSFCVMIKYRSFIFQKTNQKSFCWNIWLVFRKSKDLYLIITQKLIIWNPVDFTMKSGRFHEIHPEPYKFRCFSKNSSVWVDFTWNLPDFMKSTGFHMDFMKSGRFHVKSTQNLINSDVSAKTLQFGWISPEICRISYGFHTDFMKSGGFHVKSKDLLQGIVTLCLLFCSFRLYVLVGNNC